MRPIHFLLNMKPRRVGFSPPHASSPLRMIGTEKPAHGAGFVAMAYRLSVGSGARQTRSMGYDNLD